MIPNKPAFNVSITVGDQGHETNIYLTAEDADGDARLLSLLTKGDVSLGMFARIKAVYRNGERVVTRQYEQFYTVNTDKDRVDQAAFRLKCARTGEFV